MVEGSIVEPGASAAAEDPLRVVGVRVLSRGLTGLMWLSLAGYLGMLAVHGEGFDPAVGWLAVLTQFVPAVVCWSALFSAGPRRREIVVLAVGVSAYAAGYAVFVLAASQHATMPFPAVADVGLLCFYPAVLTAIGLAVRREAGTVPGAVWLDSLLGALSAAAVLAVLLDRVIAQASGSPLAVAVALAYPLFDLLLVATVVGIAALHGRVRRGWFPLLAGLAVFATADIVYALRVISGNYVVGTPLDGLLAIGMVLIAVWARAGGPAAPPKADRRVALAVPAIAMAASLALLVVASRTHVSVLAVSLATLTLIAAAGRTQLVFRQVRRLADLRRQATTDDLTGLPNRRAFYARVHAQLAVKGTGHAMLLLDLDKFKEVNDSLGHLVGDQMLVQVGARLADQLRESDMLARLGGDEFAVLLTDTTSEQAVAVATKLRAALAEPLTLEGIALRTDVSIGVSLAPEHGSDVSHLLRRADIAMYKAKRSGEGHCVYSGAEDTAGQGRLRTRQELRAALSEGQMTLHYQPKLDLTTNEVHGVEALVRWDHPTRGLLYPDSFLALVEEAGLMRRLTELVLEQALDQAAVWQSQGRPLTVAVNLSASSLVDSDLPEQVAALLEARELPAAALQLEITEEFLMADRDRARTILARLRDHGIQIAIDDFGTGYSSLAYLRELPIDELKLDRSFVFPMADDARAAALVFSTIDLAHSLGLRMVAEGVEHQAALTELTRHGCDQAQGYHVCRPVPVAELDHWLDQRTRQPLDQLPDSIG
ncbi:MAG: diguanylate cyclase [Pseudonocardiales bacterium]|nr:diguanylate cyclase [Pseudonocardiales bacterium]